MKKILFLAIVLFFVSTNSVQAAGYCSGHGGVSCSAGAQANGHVICTDGFTGSSGIYSQVKECQNSTTKNTSKNTATHKNINTKQATSTTNSSSKTKKAKTKNSTKKVNKKTAIKTSKKVKPKSKNNKTTTK